jgi:hypothetical protein
MSFTVLMSREAVGTFNGLRVEAERSLHARQVGKRKKKSSQAEGRFKQVTKCLSLLAENPRHPGLRTHELTSMENPHDPQGKVFEAYAQNQTPGAYRVFWCYGPEKGQITIIALTEHP